MIFSVSDILKAVVVLVITLIIGLGFWYGIHVTKKLATSEANNKTLTESVETQQTLIKKIQSDVTTIQHVNKDLRNLTQEQREEIEALTKKFSQDVHGNARDFGALAKEKPELIERLINRASQSVARCFEIATGAPRTKEEIEARSSSQINKECPDIANPNYRPGNKQ